MIRSRLGPLILVLLLLLLMSGRQTLAAPVDDFNAGIEAFRQNQYDQALEFFLRAKKDGLDTTQLDYNLASVYYRLGKYNQSKRYFENLLSDPAVAFQAQYSLALIEHKTGNKDAAIKLFEKSIELASDPRLIALVEKQIAALDGRSSADSKNWFLYFSPAYGYDSNIANTPSSEPTDLSGSFLNLLIYSEAELLTRAKNSLQLLFTYVARDYRDNSDFNLSATILGAEYRTLFKGWNLDYGLEIGRSTFGGDDYLSRETLKISSNKPGAAGRDYRIDLRYENIAGLSSQYDFLEGHRTEMKVQYRNKDQRREYRLIYQLELNDRQNTDTQNFSPTRHLLGFQYRNNLNTKIRTGVKVDYRDSDYDSAGIQSRRDKRSRLGAHADYHLGSNWTAKLETLFTRNQSSIEASEYRNRVITLSVNTIF